MKKTDWQFLIDSLMFVCVFAVIVIGIIMGLFIGQGPSGPGADKYFLGLHRHQWGDLHFILSIVFCALLILHLALDWNWIKAKAKQVFKSAWAAGLALIVILPFVALAVGWSLMEKGDQSYASYGLGSGPRNEGGPDRQSPPQAEVSPAELAGETGSMENRVPADHEERTAAHAPAARKNHASHERAERKKLAAGHKSEHGSSVTVTGRMSLREVESNTGVAALDIANQLGLPASVSFDTSLGRLRRIYGFSIEDVRDYVEKRLKTR